MKWIYFLPIWIIKKIISMLTPSCETIGFKISRSLDEEIPAWDQLVVKLHTFSCSVCAKYRLQLIHLHEKMQQINEPSQEKQNGMDVKSKEKLKDLLRNTDTPR